MTARAWKERFSRRTEAPVSIFRWDLDKTYLRSEFERFRDLVRVPFERAEDKVEIPGVPELIRSVRDTAKRRGRKALVYFVSASPPQIGRAIRDKFALDGVEIDGIVFKDQLQLIKRGKFRGLREQVGYKLTELLRGRLEAPQDAAEYLFGDDWESDPFIYSVYAGLVDGRLGGEALAPLLDRIPVDRAWREGIDALLREISPGDAVRRIFIHLERGTPPARLRPFGPRLVPVFNPFQTAACLWEEGEIDAEGIAAVAARLVASAGYTPEMLENSLEDVARRGHLRDRTLLRLSGELRALGILPSRKVPWRVRWRAFFERRAREVGMPTDFAAILDEWRALR